MKTISDTMRKKDYIEQSAEPHSTPYLGSYRDFWWNKDFTDLMAKRWGLHKYRQVLDVGCGVGHWDQLLSDYLPKDAKITGIDMESAWIESALERTKDQRDRFHYEVSMADTIPFPDHSFDLVTCQTVLLHVHDVQKVINEMYRVLKPGGLMIVVEPNNTVTELVFDSLSIDEPLEDTLKAFTFHFTCEKGQQKLGMGFDSMGDVMPGYFQKLGLKKIDVYLSDKTSPLFPPYETPEQKSFINQMEEWYRDDVMMWDKEETRKYFHAGGGEPTEFEELWQHLRSRFKARLDAIKEGTYATSGGCLLYLISGRK